jgi:hypothetical protein
MSTNVSKRKRKDLTDKIKKIHKYIAGAKQDENTRNFLVWLSEIELNNLVSFTPAVTLCTCCYHRYFLADDVANNFFW